MKVRDAVKEGSFLLKELETPFLDSVVLLGTAMNISKEKLFASYPDEIDNESLSIFRGFIRKRLSGIPVSYIRNTKEFFGLEFHVDNRVLVPRPDTETIVEAAIGIIRAGNPCMKVHDLCTGSGCIAIALKHSCGNIKISASDISPDALNVFRKNNLVLLKDEIPVFQSNLMEKITGKFDLIVSNPPYLTDTETGTMKEAGWPEPEIALDGGRDGLDIAGRLIAGCRDHLSDKGHLLIEAAADQMDRLEALMNNGGYHNIDFIKDLAGRRRVISGRYSGEV